MRAEPFERQDGEGQQGDGISGGGGQNAAPGGPQVGTRFSAEEIHENILKEASDELERPALDLAISGFASGLSIGFSFLAVALLIPRMGAENKAIASAIAYPLGFIYVVLARHQLFTENTLEPVIPLLERRDAKTLKGVMRLWAIVLVANLIGAALFALALSHTSVLEPNLNGSLLNVARETVQGGAGVVFYKGIWAGWLVALMAWLLASTKDTMAQIALVWLSTAPIAAFGFKHSIAGAAEAFYLGWLGNVSWSQVWG